MLVEDDDAVETAEAAEWKAMRTSLPFIDELKLKDADQVDAFLELYGFWMGNGTLERQQLNGGHNAVVFTPRKGDMVWLQRQLARLGFGGQQLRE